MTRLLNQLGYVGFEASDLDRWELLASKVLGLGVRRDAGALLLRMDAHDRRFIITGGPSDDVSFCGWEATDADALEIFADFLSDKGIPFERAKPSELALRAVRGMLHFRDPLGVRHEAYYGPLLQDKAFASPTMNGGFVTGDGGAGHVVFGAANYQEALQFAGTVLGAAMTDIIRQPIAKDRLLELSFLHLNERHHTLAYADIGMGKKLQHFMIEVDRVDQVGHARDRALREGFTVAQDIGQHPNDKMISIYIQTPSGFLVEYGYGGVKVHDENWEVATYGAFSEWGHRPAAALTP